MKISNDPHVFTQHHEIQILHHGELKTNMRN